MNPSLLDILACPKCKADLTLTSSELMDGRVRTGHLECRAGHRFPVAEFIPRFVPDDQYAASFGMQWTRFARTQIDRYNGTTISRDRFVQVTGWPLDGLAGRRVLDAGCGAGRFAQIALDGGAEVVAVDLSRAVDACWANLGPHERLHVVQASIYELPFKRGAFDRAYSIGVLQHTPDVERAVKAIPAFLKPGGMLAYWIYEKKFLSLMMPRYPLRLVTTRMSPARLFDILERRVPELLKLSDAVGRIPGVGAYLKRLVPVANYSGVLPLTPEQVQEWALLDTFDWLAPAYDRPQTFETVRRGLAEAGCREVSRVPGRRIGLPVSAVRA